MQKILKISVIIALLCSLLLLNGCSLFENDGSGHNFKISLSDNPQNLDPQIALDHSSVTVAKNLFIGLFKFINGQLTPAVAENFQISKDGLTYTFYLNNGFKWKTAGDFEAPVTAYDFVFAFRRLFDPSTESPHAQNYYCIAGGEDAHKGNAPLENIGVKALDDYTLEFTLAYPNAEFIYLICELPASPCNEEFFNSCKGKYGLEPENVASNGPFYVKYWLYDKYNKSNYIRLMRNGFYSEIERVYPSGVTYLIDATASEKLNNFTSKTTDVLLTDKYVKELEYGVYEYLDSTYGLVFNMNNEVFARKEVRELFAMAIDKDSLESKLSKSFTSAYSIFTKDIVMPDGSLYSIHDSAFDKEILNYNKITAQYRWNFVLSDSEKELLYNKNILVCDSFTDSDKLRAITDSWYEIFGIHFGIEICNVTDYNKRIENNEFDIVFTELTFKNNSPFGFVSDFGTKSTYGFSLDDVIQIEKSADKYITLTTEQYNYLIAEKAIVEDFMFIPVCHGKTFCYYQDDVADFIYDVAADTVYFERAKCY